MNRSTWMKTLYLGLTLALVLSACNLPLPAAQVVQPATDTPAPTDTPMPSPTSTPTITPTPTYAPPSGDPIPQLEADQEVIISQIKMFDPSNGWAIGGLSDPGANILFTKDGGETWKDVTPPENAPSEDQSDKTAFAFFLDLDTAWVVYHYASYIDIPDPAIVWRTTDRGSTWSAAPLPMVDQVDFFEPSNFTFTDTELGWLMASVGAGMSHDYTVLYRTADGGASWETLIDPYEGDELQICTKTAMVFADEQHGWITRDCLGLLEGGHLLKTEDGGASWTPLDLPAPEGAPEMLAFPNYCGSHSPKLYGLDGLMIAVDCTIVDNQGTRQRSYTYFTEDGGDTWTSSPSPGGELHMFAATQGYLLARRIFSTEDRGGDWKQIKSVSWYGQFSFIAPRLGWAVARNDEDTKLVVTKDSTATWRMLEPVIAP